VFISPAAPARNQGGIWHQWTQAAAEPPLGRGLRQV